MKTKKSLLTPLKEEKKLEPICEMHYDFNYYTPDGEWLYTKCLRCNVFLRKKKIDDDEKEEGGGNK